MSRPLRFIGRWVVAFGAMAGIALGVTLPIGMVAGLLIGLGSAAIMHLILGSPAGRLTLEQIATALDDLGVEATDLRHAPLEPTGVALVVATSPDGKTLLAKVYGRDAWDGQFLASIWSSLWHRGERPTLGFGRLQQVEHEAFVTLLAERAGMPVLPVVAAGMATQRDALLVSEVTGRSLASVDPPRSTTSSCATSGGRWARCTTSGSRTASSTANGSSSGRTGRRPSETSAARAWRHPTGR